MPFLERLFGKAWKEEFVVLYEDSSLIWFRDRDRNDPEGGIFLKDAPEMLAAGQVKEHLHPPIPRDGSNDSNTIWISYETFQNNPKRAIITRQ